MTISLNTAFPSLPDLRWVLVLALMCSTLPDADPIGFFLGIPHASVLGHRGMTHSFTFAFIMVVFVTALFFRSIPPFKRKWWQLMLFFFLVTASHDLLDTMTSSGLGISFFTPFDDSRHFLPRRPIEVSPISISAFFSELGQRVILSELLWIGLPCTGMLLMTWMRRRLLATTS